MNDQPVPAHPALRLLIVDDQPLIRRGLAMMLATEPGIEVVGQAADGSEAVAESIEKMPDIVVMDLRMPGTSGVVATREITARLPRTKVVVLTTYDDDELVFEAIRAGAHAYLLKDASEAEVLDTIRSVHRGESRLSPTIARKVMEQFRLLTTRTADESGERQLSQLPLTLEGMRASNEAVQGTPTLDDDEPLNAKEVRILELIARGMSNKQIAATVCLAEGTIKNYVSRIMDKLHAGSRFELAVRAASRR